MGQADPPKHPTGSPPRSGTALTTRRRKGSAKPPDTRTLNLPNAPSPSTINWTIDRRASVDFGFGRSHGGSSVYWPSQAPSTAVLRSQHAPRRVTPSSTGQRSETAPAHGTPATPCGGGSARSRRADDEFANESAVHANRLSSLVSWLVKPSFCIFVNSSLCIASSVTTMRTLSPAEVKSTAMLLS